MPNEKVKLANRLTLSAEVADLIGIQAGNKPHYGGKASQIINAIFSCITEALRRGESVTIPKLGTFSVHTKPPTRVPVNHFYGGKIGLRMIIDIPEKRYARFEPSPSLIELVNDGN